MDNTRNEECTKKAQETYDISWAVGVFFSLFHSILLTIFLAPSSGLRAIRQVNPLSLASARWAQDGRRVLILGFPSPLSTLFRQQWLMTMRHYPLPLAKARLGWFFAVFFLTAGNDQLQKEGLSIYNNTAARLQRNNGPRIIKTTLSLFFIISCFLFYKLIFLKSRSFLGINNDTLVSRTQTTDYFGPRYLSIRYILIFSIRF